MKKQIFAMGGGGFSMESDNPLLDKYVLSLSTKPKPKICFLATASGDAQDYINRFYRAFEKFDCNPSHLSLFKPSTSDIPGFLLKQDIIYVGGGNTRNMLVLWREWGLEKILTEAYEKGIVLTGLSAGSICWFEQGLTDSFPGAITKINCLGFLRGSNCPHFNSELDRRPTYQKLLQENKILPGLACDDGVGLHFIDGHLEKTVSSHPDAKAYRLSRDSNGIHEKQIIPTYLGGQDMLIRKASLQDAYAIHEAHMKSIQALCSKEYTEEQIKAWGHRQYNQTERHQAILNDQVWVLEGQGIIEGYAHLKIANGEGSISALYITAKMAGLRFGKRLVEMMIEACYKQRVRRIKLCSTLTAKEFYHKCGFTESNEKSSLHLGGVEIECISMEMKLL